MTNPPGRQDEFNRAVADLKREFMAILAPLDRLLDWLVRRWP